MQRCLLAGRLLLVRQFQPRYAVLQRRDPFRERVRLVRQPLDQTLLRIPYQPLGRLVQLVRRIHPAPHLGLESLFQMLDLDPQLCNAVLLTLLTNLQNPLFITESTCPQ